MLEILKAIDALPRPGKLRPKGVKDVLSGYSEQLGFNLYDFYINDYNIRPKKAGVEIETPVHKITGNDGYSDVKPYFINREGRTYYRYIDSRFNPLKDTKDCKDYLIMEEGLPQGKVLAVFDYTNNPYTHPIGENSKDMIRYRKLVAAFAISNNDGREKAVDLTPFKTAEKGLAIGMVHEDDAWMLNPSTQSYLGSRGKFIFRDNNSPEKWLSVLALKASAGEVLKAELQTGLGAVTDYIRHLTGDRTASPDRFIAETETRGISSRSSVSAVKNFTSSCTDYLTRFLSELHKSGIDLLPGNVFPDLLRTLQNQHYCIMNS